MSPRPYAGGKRRADAEQTRGRILAAATEMLAEGGTVSLDAVAKRAGVARMTVYYQFDSRRGLLEAMFDDIAGRSRIFAELPGAMADPDPRAGIRTLVSVFCDFWARDSEGLRRLNAAGGADPEVAESLHARNERRRQALRVLAERLGAARHVDLADAIFALTSLAAYSDLEPGRTPAQVEALIQDLAAAAIERLS